MAPAPRRKTRFLINPIGSAGDVIPLFEIGKELLRRGYPVVALVHPKYRDRAIKLGFSYRRFGRLGDTDRPERDPRLYKASTGWKPAMKWGTLDPLRESYEAIKAISQRGPMVVVAPGMSFAARIARETLPIRLATIHLEPMKFRSVHRSPKLPPLILPDWMPKFAKALQYWGADRFALDRLLARPTNKFRRELGLTAPVSRLLNGWWNSPDLVLGLFPDWFSPPQRDWPKPTSLTGFPIDVGASPGTG